MSFPLAKFDLVGSEFVLKGIEGSYIKLLSIDAGEESIAAVEINNSNTGTYKFVSRQEWREKRAAHETIPMLAEWVERGNGDAAIGATKEMADPKSTLVLRSRAEREGEFLRVIDNAAGRYKSIEGHLVQARMSRGSDGLLHVATDCLDYIWRDGKNLPLWSYVEPAPCVHITYIPEEDRDTHDEHEFCLAQAC